jgi:hypothetical protein
MPVTYVDDRLNEREWKVEPPIAVHSTITDYLARSISGDVLIIHGGQRDARLRAASGRELLVEAIVRVCMNGGRAIVFSGGSPIIGVRELRAILTRESLKEGLHYLLLTAIQSLPTEIDFDLLLKTVPTPDWRIVEVKRRHAAPTLLTLGLLCQSALFAFDPGSIDEETASLLGGHDSMAAMRSANQYRGDQLLAPQNWYGALGTRSASAVSEAVSREWPVEMGASSGVQDLVRALFEQSRALGADTLSRAFVDLYRALERNQELQY